MRYILWIVFFSFIVSLSDLYGQSAAALNRHSDSLYRAMEKLPDQDQKVHALFDLSFFWGDYDTTRAFAYITEAENMLGRKKEENYYRGVSAFYRASTLFDGAPDRAKESYLEADRFFVKATDSRAARYRSRSWGSYGALLQRDGEAHAYVEVLLEKAIPIAKSINDSTLLGNNLQNVAMALMNMQQYRKANQYYDMAIAILRGRKDAEEQRLTLFANAARNSLFQSNMAATRTFLDSAKAIVRGLPFSTYIPIYHAVEGGYWSKKGDQPQALKHLDTGLQSAKNIQSEDAVVGILYDKVEILKIIGRMDEAKKTLMEIVPYVEKRSLLRNKQLIYYNIAHINKLLGNFREATDWYEKYKVMADTLFVHAGEARLLELEKKYETAEKESELLRVRTRNQEQQLALDRTKNWLFIIGLICMLLLTLSILWYNAMRNRKRLAIQQSLLHQEEMKTLQQRAKINLFNAMVQGQEKERSRIARDLHDGLGGMLASVKLKLSAVANQDQEMKKIEGHTMELYGIIQQLDQSVSELRRVARNMMPESLLYMGLEAALRDLCRAMSQPNLPISFEARDLRKDYDQSFLIAVYRIVQELLTNAVKHSRASQIWLQCTESEGYFYLSVEDNGTGFDYSDALQKSTGIGLSNIKNRVELLNGQLEVDSALGKGTSFHIAIHLNG